LAAGFLPGLDAVKIDLQAGDTCLERLDQTIGFPEPESNPEGQPDEEQGQEAFHPVLPLSARAR
jgi:hypothetical protein